MTREKPFLFRFERQGPEEAKSHFKPPRLKNRLNEIKKKIFFDISITSFYH